MILAFSYYAFDETRDACATLASALARELEREGFSGIDVRPPDESARLHWHDPRLLFSQTCGLPFVREVARSAQLVATPHYAAAGCTGPDYTSVIVVRKDDPAASPADLVGRVAAVNRFDSQSGSNALFAVLPPESVDAPFLERVDLTGGHNASALRVAEGRADCAAIDSVCWAMFNRHQQDLVARLRVIARSPAHPGLPFITAHERGSHELDRIRLALFRMLADPSPELAAARRAMLLEGASVLDAAAYGSIAEMDAFVAPRVAPYLDVTGTAAH
ncbi:MAG: PhnD/SsuA/transferrin family substrate-binding protein [Rhizobiales bacterium]|nr:PhnD/SsuA/transferrin family substrate-binding protein [Hyphomicrobiales bacterium]